MEPLVDNLNHVVRDIRSLDRRMARMEGEVGFGPSPAVTAISLTGTVGTAEIYHDIVTVNSTAIIALTIPSGSGIAGKLLSVKHLGAGTVSVVPLGTVQIDGKGSIKMVAQNTCLSLTSAGGGWYIHALYGTIT